MVVLWGWAFPYERGTPITPRTTQRNPDTRGGVGADRALRLTYFSQLGESVPGISLNGRG